MHRAFPDDLQGGGPLENGQAKQLQPLFVIKPRDGKDEESCQYKPECPGALLWPPFNQRLNIHISTREGVKEWHRDRWPR